MPVILRRLEIPTIYTQMSVPSAVTICEKK